LALFAAFNSQADAAAQTLSIQSNKTQQLYTDLCHYLHPTQSKHSNSEDLFTIVRDLHTLAREMKIEKEQERLETSRQKRIDDAKKLANAMKEQQRELIGRVEQVRLHQESKRSSLTPNQRAAAN